MQLATAEAYARDPAFVWRWYMDRFGLIEQAVPNPGHHALAELERLVPLTVVTQNIDGLHQRAGSTRRDRAARQRPALQVRGRAPRRLPLADVAGSDEAPPRCPHCGDLIRPDVVWFGEALPADALERALELAARCDVLIAVGTSGVVYPAALVPAHGQAGRRRADRRQPRARRLRRGRRLVPAGTGRRGAAAARGARRRAARLTRAARLARAARLSLRAADSRSSRRSSSPGRRPAAARRTTKSMRRARVSGRFAWRTWMT